MTVTNVVVLTSLGNVLVVDTDVVVQGQPSNSLPVIVPVLQLFLGIAGAHDGQDLHPLFTHPYGISSYITQKDELVQHFLHVYHR